MAGAVALLLLEVVIGDAYSRCADRLRPGWKRRVVRKVRRATVIPRSARKQLVALIRRDGFWQRLLTEGRTTQGLGPSDLTQGFVGEVYAVVDPRGALHPELAVRQVETALAAMWAGLRENLPDDFKLSVELLDEVLGVRDDMASVQDVVDRLMNDRLVDLEWLRDSLLVLERKLDEHKVQLDEHGTKLADAHQGVRDLARPVAETRDAVGRIEQQMGTGPDWNYPLPLSPGAGCDKALASHPIAPGSRDTELKQAMSRIAGSPGGAAVLVRGDVFRGKTTFVCELVRRLRASQRPVVSFFNERGGGQGRTDCLVSLNAQLIELLGPRYEMAPDHELVRQFRALLDLAATAGGGLVVVVDALDEARDRDLVIEALNYRPPGVAVVATSRPNPPLPPGHVLSDEPWELDEIPEASKRKEKAEAWVRKVVGSREPHTINVFATLAAAEGPISPGDIADLWGQPVEAINTAMAPYADWVTRPDRHEQVRLGHNHLKDELNKKTPILRVPIEEQLQAWARRYADQGWPAPTTPRYLLAYWPDHCAEVTQRAELLCGPWLDTTIIRLDGPRHAAAVARGTFHDLAENFIDTGDHLSTLIQLARVAKRLHSSATSAFPAFITALIDNGYPDRAFSYALASRDLQTILTAAAAAPNAIKDELLTHAQNVIHNHIRDPGTQAGAWLALVPHLPPDKAEQMIRDEITQPWLKAKAWTALVPHLDDPSTALAEAEQLIRNEIRDPGTKARLWAALVPHLAPAEAERAIRDEITDWWEKARAWVALLPRLTPDKAEQVIRNDITKPWDKDPWEKTEAWVALVPRLTPDKAEQVIRNDITKPENKVAAWTALVPHLDDPSTALAEAEQLIRNEIRDPESKAKAWTALFPHLTPDTAEQVIRNDITYGNDKARAWVALFARLAPAKAEQVIRNDITYPENKVAAWTALVPHLDDPSTALAEAEQLIRNEIRDPESKAKAWTALVPHLTPDTAEQVIRNEITDPRQRAEAWVALVPHLDHPTTALAEAEQVIRDGITQVATDAEAWTTLIPRLDDPSTALAEAEQMIRNDITHPEDKARARVALVPHLAPAEAEQMIRNDITEPWGQGAWVALVPRLPAAKAEQVIRNDITTPWGQFSAWVALAPHLDDPTIALAEAEQVIRNKIRDPMKAKAWTKLIPHLDDPSTALAEAERLIRNDITTPWGQDSDWVALIPHLPPAKAEQVIRHELTAAAPTKKAEAWTMLIPRLDDPGTALTEAEQVIRQKVTDPRQQAEAWVALVPHLPPDKAEQVIRQEITDPRRRAEAWVALVPHLDDPSTALTEAEQVIRDEITDRRQQTEAWVALVPHLPPDKAEQVIRQLPLWANVPAGMPRGPLSETSPQLHRHPTPTASERTEVTERTNRLLLARSLAAIANVSLQRRGPDVNPLNLSV